MASMASPSSGISSEPLSSTNRSICRSNRGLSAKPTRARFSSALRSMREARDGSSWFLAGSATSFPRLAERGQPAVDLGQVERLGFFRVVLGPVLDRGVALVPHTDRVVLPGVTRHHLLQRDLVFPAGPEDVRVADLPAGLLHVPEPDRQFVPGLVKVHERVAVLLLPRLEHVQVVAV